MPTNEQRREAAKRKLERQLARRAERVKRRRVIGVIVTVIGVVAVVGLVYWLANLGPDGDEAAANPTESESAEPKTSGGPCSYTEDTAEEVPNPPGLPADPDPTPNSGTVKVSLKTNQGEIPLTLDRAKAPCTVQSIEHLVQKSFFNGTKCHRLTTSKGLKVLQCGDPQGTGGGGPGYTIKDEPPTDLKPAADPTAAEQGASTYPRGTLAMANTGQPNSGGSQFFMVYGDSTLPPNYAIFGTVDGPGLAVLDKIAAGGASPQQGQPAGQPAEDGAPKLPVNIDQAVVG